MSKIIIIFLTVLTLANLGLTFYFNQPKDVGVDSPTMARLQNQQQELLRLQEELISVKAKLAGNVNEISRMKTDHVGLSTRVSSISTSTPLPYEAPLKQTLTAPNAGEPVQGEPK